MKKWFFLAAGLLFAVPAIAQGVADGNSTTYKNQFQGAPVGGVTSDTTFKVLRMDASGNLSADDADRDRDKTDALTLLSAVSLAAATSSSVSTFTPFTASYTDALKWVRVTITGGGAGAPWSLVFLGSGDATTYSYLMQSPPSIAGSVWLDADTLKVRGHGPTPSGGILIPVATRSGYPVITKNLAVIARYDSSAGAALVFTVEALGRGH